MRSGRARAIVTALVVLTVSATAVYMASSEPAPRPSLVSDSPAAYGGPERGREAEDSELEVAARDRTELADEVSSATAEPTSPGAEPSELLVAEELDELTAALELLPEYDGTNAGMRRKYAGLDASALARVYPILRELRSAEVEAALDAAIARGEYETEIVPPGETLDPSRLGAPGDLVQAIGHRAEPLPGGGYEYKIVRFDEERFRGVYVRLLEDQWVHEQVDRAGLCPYCAEVVGASRR